MARAASDNIAYTALRASAGLLGFVFALSFAVNLLRLSGPIFMLLIYDRVIPSRSPETLTVLFAMLVVLLLALGLMDYSRRRLIARVAARFQERVEEGLLSATPRQRFFSRTAKKPIEGLEQIDQIRGFLHSGPLLSWLDFVWTPMFLLVVFALHWIIGSIALAGVGVLLLLSFARNFFGSARQARAQEATRSIQALKDMMFASRGALRNHEMTRAFSRRWIEARKLSRDRAISNKDLDHWFMIMIRQSRMLLQYTVLATGAFLFLRGEVSIGAMVAATFLVVRVIVPFENVLSHLPDTVTAVRNWRRLKEIAAEITRPVHLEDPDDFRPSFEANGLSVRSPLTRGLLLRGVTLSIRPGSLVEIIGPSNAGKTVLAETLLGNWPRAAGTLTCGGIGIDRLSSEQAGRILGYVPQSEEFLDGTIEENITGLDPEPDGDRLYAAARLAFLHAAVTALPEGYQTAMDKAGSTLSRGQKSRIAFARAVYNQPRILIIDEPDGWLRASLPRRLSNFVDAFLASGGVIIILSRSALDLPATTGRFFLEDGRLRPDDPPSNVTRLPEKTARTHAGG